MASVRLAPATRKPVGMANKPPVTLGVPSLSNVMTEKQKALAKLSALVPLTSGMVLIATNQLSHVEWFQYKSRRWGVFEFLNSSLSSGILYKTGSCTVLFVLIMCRGSVDLDNQSVNHDGSVNKH
jgi:hypothetical protein